MSAKHVHLSEHPGYSSLGIFQTYGRREEYTDLEANRRPSRAGGGCEFCLPRGIRDELTGTEIRIGTCTGSYRAKGFSVVDFYRDKGQRYRHSKLRRNVMNKRTILALTLIPLLLGGTALAAGMRASDSGPGKTPALAPGEKSLFVPATARRSTDARGNSLIR